ncbi:hypothetical protein INR49_001161 [Caranx melampygus]|nr:hypothetical protein INR49_001161 [Caranx melampygus]
MCSSSVLTVSLCLLLCVPLCLSSEVRSCRQSLSVSTWPITSCCFATYRISRAFERVKSGDQDQDLVRYQTKTRTSL